METSDPASNKWEDKGFVLSSMSDKGKNWARSSTSDWIGYFYYNAIDPTYIITP
jgi:arabinan endo-1,5-alpha-L-arabinosidase